MNAQPAGKKLSPANRTRLIMMGAGLVAGLVAGVIGARISSTDIVDLSRMGWSDHLALLLAAMMIATGVLVSLSSFSARGAARILDPGSQSPAKPAQTIFVRQQGIVMLLAGILMGAPVVTGLVFDPLPRGLGMAMMAALIGLLLIQTGCNINVWMRADEMMRRLISESATFCFWILQGGLFLWAAAEKLGLAPALGSWDAMTILMAVYLVVSSVMAARRGFA